MHRNTSIIEQLTSLINVFRTLDIYGLISAIIEILIIAFAIYYVLMWLKDTRAWSILKGVIVICVFFLVAYIFNFTVILAIAKYLILVVAIGIVIIFQSDIRSGLEHLGRKSFFSKLIPDIGKFNKITSDNVIQEIVDASFIMGKARTGALIVIEQKESLEDIERTGITIDGKVSKQLLINIFEKNTPLHDGAVLIVGDVVKAATCYLPLSTDKSISKDLGTRHRAALGVSENSDSLTIVVSEETGHVSTCYRGEIQVMADERELIKFLKETMYNPEEKNEKTIVRSMKGWFNAK